MSEPIIDTEGNAIVYRKRDDGIHHATIVTPDTTTRFPLDSLAYRLRTGDIDIEADSAMLVAAQGDLISLRLQVKWFRMSWWSRAHSRFVKREWPQYVVRP